MTDEERATVEAAVRQHRYFRRDFAETPIPSWIASGETEKVRAMREIAVRVEVAEQVDILSRNLDDACEALLARREASAHQQERRGRPEAIGPTHTVGSALKVSRLVFEPSEYPVMGRAGTVAVGLYGFVTYLSPEQARELAAVVVQMANEIDAAGLVPTEEGATR